MVHAHSDPTLIKSLPHREESEQEFTVAICGQYCNFKYKRTYTSCDWGIVFFFFSAGDSYTEASNIQQIKETASVFIPPAADSSHEVKSIIATLTEMPAFWQQNAPRGRENGVKIRYVRPLGPFHCHLVYFTVTHLREIMNFNQMIGKSKGGEPMGHILNCHVYVVGASTLATSHLYMWQVGISKYPFCTSTPFPAEVHMLRFISGWVFSVWIQMQLQVKRWVTAMMAPFVEEKVMGNPENTIASPLAPARGRRRPANPNSACWMWVHCIFQSLVNVRTSSAYCLLPVSPSHVIRFAIQVIKWWNASWRPTTTKWWHLNLIWMVMHQKK